jgi:protein TonB
MRPLIWVQAAALVLISALSALPATAQATSDPVPAVPVAAEPPPASPPAPPIPTVLTGTVWTEQAHARDFARLYPRPARNANIGAYVTFDCLVASDGQLTGCTITREEPPGYGFDEATIVITQKFRVAPFTTDGIPTAGGRVRRTIRWLMR